MRIPVFSSALRRWLLFCGPSVYLSFSVPFALAQDAADGGMPEEVSSPPAQADATHEENASLAGESGEGDASALTPTADVPLLDAEPAELAGDAVSIVGGDPSAFEPGAMPPESAAIQVTARSYKSEAQELQSSAEAVNVVELKKASQETADLGEVLARTQGVSVRRFGGLGSGANIALNGLQGDQVRLFLDGVPLQLAGYPFGLVNVPVGLLSRVEVYRGVVPIRFGSDALGGAINLVSRGKDENYLTGSYQAGSFGIHRATLSGRYRHERTGFLLGFTGFNDSARNDFWMHDRKIAQDDGTTVERDVRRFHDAYRAHGGNFEIGVTDKRWARRLVLQPFFSTYHKEMQHNAVMSTPYGGITYGEANYGATARYEVELPRDVELELVANYVNRSINFRDLSTYVFEWTGEPLRTVGRSGAGARGELTGEAIYQTAYEQSVFGRAQASWRAHPNHTFRASVTPQFVTRYPDDKVEGRVNDKLQGQIFQVVGGVEHELSLFSERLSNVAFGKAYYYRASQEKVSSEFTGRQRSETTQDRATWGAGDALRFEFTEWLLGKASYEYATRLPRSDELFGNNVLVQANTTLKPERSHNFNLGPRLSFERTRFGSFIADANFFLRESRDLIVLLPRTTRMPYLNISSVRGFGFENAVSWVSPKQWLSLDGSYTWQDLRNTSKDGPFAPFKGMRIPARPYMFASWAARGRIPRLPGNRDTLEPFYYGRFVQAFERGWDLGTAEYPVRIEKQFSHDVGITYTKIVGGSRIGCTFEIDNLADAVLYDYFGVQRPGRSYNLKVIGDM